MAKLMGIISLPMNVRGALNGGSLRKKQRQDGIKQDRHGRL